MAEGALRKSDDSKDTLVNQKVAFITGITGQVLYIVNWIDENDNV